MCGSFRAKKSFHWHITFHRFQECFRFFRSYFSFLIYAICRYADMCKSLWWLWWLWWLWLVIVVVVVLVVAGCGWWWLWLWWNIKVPWGLVAWWQAPLYNLPPPQTATATPYQNFIFDHLEFSYLDGYWHLICHLLQNSKWHYQPIVASYWKLNEPPVRTHRDFAPVFCLVIF